MRLTIIPAGLAFALCLPLAAEAATDGLYLSAAAGGNFATDAKAQTGSIRDTIKYDAGSVGALSLGYGFANGYRAELDVSMRRNTINGVKNNSLTSAGGNTGIWGVLINGLYDFRTGTALTPYIGAGVGLGIITGKLTGSGITQYDKTDQQLAYQGIVGVSYAMTERFALTADYRYFATTDAKFKNNGNDWTVANGSHSLLAGLRWTFAARPAPESPRPASAPPAVTPDYLVFFDWNKTEISSEARKIIGDAATAAGITKPITIVVTGHTDTSGSPAYNQKLSDRRADAVKTELVQLGVNPALIRTIGKGESELLVPTAADVREPSNRRSQIALKVG